MIVRILRDYANRDGWSIRTIPDNDLGFITNLSQVIEQLDPGQIWEATLLDDNSKYKIFNLDTIARD